MIQAPAWDTESCFPQSLVWFFLIRPCALHGTGGELRKGTYCNRETTSAASEAFATIKCCCPSSPITSPTDETTVTVTVSVPWALARAWGAKDCGLLGWAKLNWAKLNEVHASNTAATDAIFDRICCISS
jgi:hypothetical protein